MKTWREKIRAVRVEIFTRELQLHKCLSAGTGSRRRYAVAPVKRRYLVCELHFEGAPKTLDLKDYDIYKAVLKAIVTAHGDYGLGVITMSLNVKYFHIGTRITLIRVKRAATSLLQTALVFVKSIATVSVSLQTLHIAGSIRSCQKFLIGYHKRNLSEFQKDCKTKADKMRIELLIHKCCDRLENANVSLVTNGDKLTDT